MIRLTQQERMKYIVKLILRVSQNNAHLLEKIKDRYCIEIKKKSAAYAQAYIYSIQSFGTFKENCYKIHRLTDGFVIVSL